METLTTSTLVSETPVSNRVKNLTMAAALAGSVALTMTVSNTTNISPFPRTVCMTNNTVISSNLIIPEKRKKRTYRDRYKRIGESQWFKNAYENKSLGDVVAIEG